MKPIHFKYENNYTVTSYVTDRVFDLIQEKDLYISKLEAFIRSNSGDMARFIVDNKIKSPRNKARIEQDEKRVTSSK